METNFELALKQVLVHEGGLTNLKGDSGGLTNLGIIHEEYDRYRRFKGLPLRSVSLITKAEAEDIYRTFYWNAIHGDLLPSGVDNCLFDMAVNNGPAGAIRCAQKVVNSLGKAKITVDGHIGPITVDAIDDIDAAKFINAFCDQRIATDKTFRVWSIFGRAWSNRINGNAQLKIIGVRKESLDMILTVMKVEKPPLPQPTAKSFLEVLASFVAKLLHLS